MRKQKHITAFYLETLLLIAVFTGVIMILTRVFAVCGEQSVRAKQYTAAVSLAENTAEMFSASDSAEDLLALLNETDNAKLQASQTRTLISADYDEQLQPQQDGVYHVKLDWTPEQGDAGTMVSGEISVFYGQQEQPLYTLQTAVYLQEVSQ